MKFYGLHWIADDGTPLQVRIETRTLRCWARSCPRGGEWTAWRRLDVEYNADGSLNINCANANHASFADACGKLANACTIQLSGAVTGAGSFDGSGDVHIITSMGETGGGDGGGDALAALEQRVAALEAQGGGESLKQLRERLDKLDGKVGHIDQYLRNYGPDYQDQAN